MTATSRFGVLAAARVVCLVIIACLLLFLHTAAPTVRASGSTFIVDRTDDGGSGCTNKHCTLRGAIENANNGGTFNNIRFSKTINWALNPIVLSASLPTITSQGTWIDGSNEDGALVYPVINANGVGDAIVIAASDVTISNLSVYGVPASASDIHVLQRATLGLTTINTMQIAYNWIGAPRNRTSCAALNSVNSAGVRVDADTSSGVAAYIYGNIVVCHGGPGIYLARNTTDLLVTVPSGPVRVGQRPDNVPTVNWVGVNPSGNAMPNDVGVSVCQSVNDRIIANILAYNAHDGVAMTCAAGPGFPGAQHIVVGSGASERNYIYGNGRYGLYLNGDNNDVSIQGNYIGLDGADVVHANGAGGINILGNSTVCRIGGSGELGNVISGNTGSGISIIGGGAHDCVVQGNRIGLHALSAAVAANSADGITLAGGTHNIILGGGSSTLGNLIAGNGNHGIHINGSATTAITVSTNLVGTNGTLALPNQAMGILIEDVAAAQTPLVGNVISGNAGAGVWIKNSAYVTLRSNYIGLNPAGLSAMPNGNDGVAITAGSHHNMVGGPTSAERNFIGGNTFSGVFLGDAGTVSNTVASNFIGLNGTGSAAVPNGYAGIAVIAADNNTIGGGGSGLQFISGNTREGVYMANASSTFVDQSNFVGVGSNQTSALGNGLEGIKLDPGTHGAQIDPALVAYNGGSGIAVLGTATANHIVPLAVRTNGGLPIDLGEDGATLNDPGDGDTGPNTLLNYPVVTAGTESSVSGIACANCMVHIYQIASGGGTHLAATPANGAGNWSATLPNGLTRKDVRLLAVAPTGDTSEMSLGPTISIFLPLIRR